MTEEDIRIVITIYLVVVLILCSFCFMAQTLFLGG